VEQQAHHALLQIVVQDTIVMAQVQELHVVQVLGQMQVLLLILVARRHYVQQGRGALEVL
jgi:hypothetical protein